MTNTTTFTEPAHMSSMRLTDEAADARDVVQNWHRDEGHPYSFWTCQMQPCHAVNRVPK